MLSRLRFLAYEAIYQHQDSEPFGVTSGELDRILSTKRGVWSRSSSPRLVELVRSEAIEELEPRACTKTGQTVICYCTTGRLPANGEVERRVTLSKKEKREACQALLELWPRVPENLQPIVQKLGRWLRQQGGKDD